MMRVIQVNLPSIVWKVLQEFYTPKPIMETRRAAREFEVVRMIESKDAADYFVRMDA